MILNVFVFLEYGTYGKYLRLKERDWRTNTRLLRLDYMALGTETHASHFPDARDDATLKRCQVFHLCGFMDCFSSAHLTFETDRTNRGRSKCAANLQSCDHEPKCIPITIVRPFPEMDKKKRERGERRIEQGEQANPQNDAKKIKKAAKIACGHFEKGMGILAPLVDPDLHTINIQLPVIKKEEFVYVDSD